MSITGWMDKQNVVYPYSRILFILKKEGNPVTCYNMDEPWGHDAKWSKPVTKRQILYDSTYKVSKIIKFIETESRMVGEEKNAEMFNGYSVSNLQDKNFCRLVALQCEYT